MPGDESHRQQALLQVFVFRGSEHLGWDCFCKEQVVVGSGPDADLRLEDSAVEEAHVILRIAQGSVLASYPGQKRAHASATGGMVVGPLDAILVGPFTLKVKLNKGSKQLSAGPSGASIKDEPTDRAPQAREDSIPGNGSFTLTFEGRIRQGMSQAQVIENLARLLRKDSASLERLFSGKKIILKKNASHDVVRELRDMFEEAGALCFVEHGETIPPESCERAHDQTDERAETVCRPLPEQVQAPAGRKRGTGEDDDDDGFRPTFSLKDSIRDGRCVTEEHPAPAGQDILLEVVKTRHDAIMDVRFLGAKEKYFIRTGQGVFCLAENRGKGEVFLYLQDQDPAGVQTASTGKGKGPGTDQHPPVRGRQLTGEETAVFHHGPYEYLLRLTRPGKSPRIQETPKGDREYVRHFGRSVVIHVIILVILGMMPTYKPEPLSQDSGRFVKVDSRQMDEIRKRIQPPQLPKKAPEIIREKEKQLAQRVPKKALPKGTAERTAAPSPADTRKVASAAGEPQAGAPVRNVRQTGILSMLGDNIGIKPQEAMAAVTNLDAVSSSAQNSAQFKVGGIVGKLDGGRIEIPKAGIVNTKGSSQVMGSGSGGALVAALDKGSTGKNQVKAKVSARLSKTVKVAGGGMSREEVKRIIDMHLEEITRCYETALVANPSLMGRVVFEWKILMSGRVGEVSVKSSTLNSSDIHACIQSSIKSWEFPQPEGNEVIVSYPFIFDIVGF